MSCSPQPSDVGEALYISIILKTWFRDAIVAEKPDLTEQELEALEQSVLERIVRRKDGEEPTLLRIYVSV